MNTLCLYEYPAALRDIKGWVSFMVDNDKMVGMDWTNPLKPTFEISHNPFSDRYRSSMERVTCIPLEVLKGAPLDPSRPQLTDSPDIPENIDKIIIFGSIRPSIIPFLSDFLKAHEGSLQESRPL